MAQTKKPKDYLIVYATSGLHTNEERNVVVPATSKKEAYENFVAAASNMQAQPAYTNVASVVLNIIEL